MAPQAFGRYEIRAEIGRGGMATVYQAYDPHFRREVAIKVLPREFLHDQTFRARFSREAQIIAGLEHPAIVPVYDFGEEDGQPYLIMGLMSGGSLASHIRQGPLPLDEAVRIIDRIAPALDEAHQAGMIHRDIKPANILFDKRGKAYLSDFGIVKVTEATAQLTGSGMIGTPAYMAPEVARAGGLTSLVDVYALGVTLFQMLTGHLPYQADTPLGVIMAHATQPVPNLRDFRPDLPELLQGVIEHAMAKDPMDRVPTAGALAEELEAAVQACTTQQLTDAVTEQTDQIMSATTSVTASPPSIPVLTEARTMPVADVPATPVEAQTVPDEPAMPFKQRPAHGKGRPKERPEKKAAFPIPLAVLGGVVVVGLVVGALALSGVLGGNAAPAPTQAVAASTQAPAAPTQAPPIPTRTPSGPRKDYTDLVVCYVQRGTAGDLWATAQAASIKETARSLEIKQLIYSESPQVANQIEAIRKCIEQKADVIGLDPAETGGWEGVLAEARGAEIPVILVDRRAEVPETLYASYLGSDFVDEGHKAGTELAAQLMDRGNVVEIAGHDGPAANDRSRGFRKALRDHPNITLVDTRPGDWSPDGGRNAMAAFLKEGISIQGVFAQNDEMALGAIQAIQTAGLKPGVDIKIVSIDGIRKAFDAIIAGKLNATIECSPITGPQFFEMALRLVNQEPVDKWVKTNEGVFTQETAAQELPNRKY